MHIRIVIFSAVLLLPRLAFAAPPEGETRRAPWEWTDEERFAALMDKEAAAQRVKTDREHQNRSPLKAESSSVEEPYPFVDVIVGKRDPHLLFPIELFMTLVVSAYSENTDERLSRRVSAEETRRALGLPDDMWDRLEAISAAYRAAEAANIAYSVSHSEKTNDVNPTVAPLCRERYAALIEAEQTFGPKFKQFLYMAVAPTLSVSYVHRLDERFLRVAKGHCS